MDDRLEPLDVDQDAALVDTTQTATEETIPLKLSNWIPDKGLKWNSSDRWVE